MPASPGGSVVAQSLLRQAADRGVTICFADLDGADGLWVPEERTVLVSRGLPDEKVAEVIEHELAHMMIDDQHADLDAGKDVLVREPPPQGRRREAAALAAALGLVAVVGGVMYGIHTARDPVKQNRVAPNPNGPGLSAQESGDPKPSTTVITTTLPDGRVVQRTVVITQTPPLPTGTGSPIAIPTGTATATKRAPGRTPGPTVSAPGPTSSAPVPPPVTSDPPVPTTLPPVPTTDPPTSPAAESAGAGGTGVGGTDNGTDNGTDSGPAGTDQATVADVSAAMPVGDTTAP